MMSVAFFNLILSVFMLNVIMLNVIVLNVIVLNVFLLSAMAPFVPDKFLGRV